METIVGLIGCNRWSDLTGGGNEKIPLFSLFEQGFPGGIDINRLFWKLQFQAMEKGKK